MVSIGIKICVQTLDKSLANSHLTSPALALTIFNPVKPAQWVKPTKPKIGKLVNPKNACTHPVPPVPSLADARAVLEDPARSHMGPQNTIPAQSGYLYDYLGGRKPSQNHACVVGH